MAKNYLLKFAAVKSAAAALLGFTLLSFGCAAPSTVVHPVAVQAEKIPTINPVMNIAGCPTGDWQHRLVIHHFDVGQGDSTFLRTPSGTTILVDGGRPAKGAEVIVPTIKKCYGLNELDYVVLTHFDIDHYGGLNSVFSEFKIRKAVYDPGDSVIMHKKFKSDGITAYRALADSSGKRKVPPLTDDAIETGDKTLFQIIAVGGRVRGLNSSIGTPSNDNSMSIAISLHYGTFDYFIAGDLTGGGNGTPDVESEVAKLVGDVDILHANHHGSNTSNNAFFLKTLQPEQIVISVGDNNYHLPNAKVLERMFQVTSLKNIFQTEKGNEHAPENFLSKMRVVNGDIIVVADRDSYSINGQQFATDGISGLSESHFEIGPIGKTAEKNKIQDPHDNIIFHGNVDSHKFHKKSCQFYNCKLCIAEFKSKKEAVSKGYKPCKVCNP